MAKIMSLREAVAEMIHDGDSVALEGFTHLIPHAAGHEIMRQGKTDLTLILGRQSGRGLAASATRRRGKRLAPAAGDRRT